MDVYLRYFAYKNYEKYFSAKKIQRKLKNIQKLMFFTIGKTNYLKCIR